MLISVDFPTERNPMERKDHFVTAVPPTPAEVRAAATEWRRRGLFKRLTRADDSRPAGAGSA
jgi:hypothetical protein